MAKNKIKLGNKRIIAMAGSAATMIFEFLNAKTKSHESARLQSPLLFFVYSF
jgi:hypothetical protein